MSNRNYWVICDDNCKFEGMTKEQIISAIVEATGNTPTNIDDAFITKIKEMNKQSPLKFWIGTTAEFNALQTKEQDALYILTDDDTADSLDEILQAFENLQEQFDNIISGTTVVGSATSAGYATSAGHATTAVTAEGLSTHKYQHNIFAKSTNYGDVWFSFINNNENPYTSYNSVKTDLLSAIGNGKIVASGVDTNNRPYFCIYAGSGSSSNNIFVGSLIVATGDLGGASLSLFTATFEDFVVQIY